MKQQTRSKQSDSVAPRDHPRSAPERMRFDVLKPRNPRQRIDSAGM